MIRLRFRRAGHRLRPGSLLGLWMRFGPLMRPSWTLLAGAFGSTIGYALLQLLRPWPLKIAIDAVTGGHGVDLPLPWLAGGADLPTARLAWVAGGAILAIAGLASLAAYGQSYLGAKSGQLLAYRLRRDLFRHLHRLSLEFHDRARTGDLVLRLTSDMNLVRNLLVSSTLRLGSQILVVFGVAGLLLRLDLALGIAALSVVPFLLLSAASLSRRIRTAVRKQRRREGELAATSAESFGSIEIVKLHRAEETERERFLASHRKSLRTGLRATKLQAALERRVELLVAVGTCLVLAIGLRAAAAGRITAGDLVLAVSYLGLLYKPMRAFSRLTGRLAKSIVAAERIVEVLDEVPEELHAPGSERPELTGALSMRDVRFGYAGGADVLHGVDLEIAAGERIALVGRSGAGKSSLVRLLPRLYTPRSGSIVLDGVPIERIELAWLRDRIAFVLQETVLLGIRVRDNITYGSDDLDDAAVERAARRAGIHERILRLPEGYDTILDENGRGLSGGERQRVALARAFARRTPIVVLDEPDTFLDPAVREALWEAIEDVTVGRTAICIVHDVGRALAFDRIAVMNEGRIVGIGRHDELMAVCPAYRDLWNAGAGRGGSLVAAR